MIDQLPSPTRNWDSSDDEDEPPPVHKHKRVNAASRGRRATQASQRIIPGLAKLERDTNLAGEHDNRSAAWYRRRWKVVIILLPFLVAVCAIWSSDPTLSAPRLQSQELRCLKSVVAELETAPNIAWGNETSRAQRILSSLQSNLTANMIASMDLLVTSPTTFSQAIKAAVVTGNCSGVRTATKSAEHAGSKIADAFTKTAKHLELALSLLRSTKLRLQQEYENVMEENKQSIWDAPKVLGQKHRAMAVMATISQIKKDIDISDVYLPRLVAPKVTVSSLIRRYIDFADAMNNLVETIGITMDAPCNVATAHTVERLFRDNMLSLLNDDADLAAFRLYWDSLFL